MRLRCKRDALPAELTALAPEMAAFRPILKSAIEALRGREREQAASSGAISPDIFPKLNADSGDAKPYLGPDPWRAKDPERARSLNRGYYAKHREKRLAAKRDRYQRVSKAQARTPEGRFKERDRKARRRALTRAGRVTLAEWQAILEAHGHRCAYCGNGDLPLEQDHVIPLSKGGEHAAHNIVPACKPCNSAKGAR